MVDSLMTRDKGVNDHVRRKLRERVKKNLKIKDMAGLAGIPTSSYACMESGFYNINLDNLFRMLGSLEADIREVWPVETIGSQTLGTPVYLRKIQEFRLSEVIALCEAQGAALFSLDQGTCRLLLHQGLSDFLLDRLHFCVEDRRDDAGGLWFQHRRQDSQLYLFLKTQSSPSYLRKLIQHYLIIWSHVFQAE